MATQEEDRSHRRRADRRQPGRCWRSQKQLGDVVLYDIPAAEGLVKGKALDINQLSAVDGYDCRVTGTTDWKDVAGSDVVIITAACRASRG